MLIRSLFATLIFALPLLAQSWSFKNPLPTGNNLHAICTNGPMIIGVGQSGTIITSNNGTSWNVAASPTKQDLHAIAYSGSLYVAAGKNGTILTSSTGITWSPAVSGTSVDFYSICFGLTPAKFIVCGSNGAVFTSSNGTTWSASNSTVSISLNVAITSGSTAFICGNNGTILSSPDGTTWTQQNSSISTDLFSIAASGSRYCAVGAKGVLVGSNNGSQWTQLSNVTDSTDLFTVTTRNDTFIVAGALGKIATSVGAVSFTQQSSPTSLDIRAAGSSTTGVLLVGNAGCVVMGTSVSSYANVGTYLTRDVNSIATKGGTTGNVFVAVGKQGLVLTSTDGSSWTNRSVNSRYDFLSIAYGNNRYVAVGQHGLFATSTDGTTWTVDSLLARWGSYNDLYQVKWLTNKFIATGAWGVMFYSSTGTSAASWTLTKAIPQQDAGTGGSPVAGFNTKEIRGIGRTNNKLIAVGDYGMIAYANTSTDSIWTNTPYVTRNWLFDVTWTGTRAIAVGANGTVVRSADGISWSLAACTTTVDLHSVVWTGDTLFAVGKNGTILLSSDTGVTWKARENITPNNLYGVLSTATAVYAVGAQGTILSAPTNGGSNGSFVKQDSLVVPYPSSITRGSDFAAYRFPGRSGAIDVTKNPFNADKNGELDATDAIQRAIDTAEVRRNNLFGMVVVYIPNGTYKISRPLRYKLPEYTAGPHLQGESRTGTILKLVDSTYKLGTEAQPVISTGDGVAQCFNRGLRNLTINTGKGNPGAIGVYYYGNNQSIMSDVDIISEDGLGMVGLHLGYVEQGPALARKIYIKGFDVGIQSQSKNSVVLSQITIECQRRYGIVNEQHPLFIDSLRSHNKVTAVLNQSNASLTLVDANLTGGLSDRDAIVNATGGTMFARGVSAAGYRRALSNTTFGALSPSGLLVSEYYTQPRSSLFAGAPSTTLKLPKKYPVDPAWENDSTKWAFVNEYHTGSKSWTTALQEAIDVSGATTVCIPAGIKLDSITDTVRLRGSISRIIGTGGVWKSYIGNGCLVVENGSSPIVKIERLTSDFKNFPIIVRTSRTVILESVVDGPIILEGAGEVHASDLVAEVTLKNALAKLWITYYDGEGSTGAVFNQLAGTTRIFGWKDEGAGTSAKISGGTFEVLGFVNYSNNQPKPDTSGEFYISNANASIAGATQLNYCGTWYDLLVKQTIGSTTKELRVGNNPAGKDLPLFTASTAATSVNLNQKQICAPFSIGFAIRRQNALLLSWQIDRAQPVSIRLVNAQGRVVLSRKFDALRAGSNQTALSLPLLAHGMYYVQMNADTRKTAKSFMW